MEIFSWIRTNDPRIKTVKTYKYEYLHESVIHGNEESIKHFFHMNPLINNGLIVLSLQYCKLNSLKTLIKLGFIIRNTETSRDYIRYVINSNSLNDKKISMIEYLLSFGISISSTYLNETYLNFEMFSFLLSKGARCQLVDNRNFISYIKNYREINKYQKINIKRSSDGKILKIPFHLSDREIKNFLLENYSTNISYNYFYTNIPDIKNITKKE